jgi:hypothetical protein
VAASSKASSASLARMSSAPRFMAAPDPGMVQDHVRIKIYSGSPRSCRRRRHWGLRLCEHLEHEDGAIVFAHACRIGLEGIVSKRRDSPYRSRRSPDWLKSKNPASVAAAREAEEDWYN